MSEQKLLNNRCPQCGEKLRVKKGIYYTFTTCSACKLRLAWPKEPHGDKNEPVFLADRSGFLERTVFENGIRLAGYSYFHQALVPYIGMTVLVKAKPFGVDVFDEKKALICADLSHEWFRDSSEKLPDVFYADIRVTAYKDPEGAVRLSKMYKAMMDKPAPSFRSTCENARAHPYHGQVAAMRKLRGAK